MFLLTFSSPVRVQVFFAVRFPAIWLLFDVFLAVLTSSYSAFLFGPILLAHHKCCTSAHLLCRAFRGTKRMLRKITTRACEGSKRRLLPLPLWHEVPLLGLSFALVSGTMNDRETPSPVSYRF